MIFSEGNCEINGATREMSPGSYRERLGWIYYAIKGRTSLSLIQFLHVLGFFCTKMSIKALCPNRCNNYKITPKTFDPLENWNKRSKSCSNCYKDALYTEILRALEQKTHIIQARITLLKLFLRLPFVLQYGVPQLSHVTSSWKRPIA